MKPTKRFTHSAVPVGIAFLLSALVPDLRAQDYDPEQTKRAVVRVSLLNGDVSVRRGDGDVVAAAPNAPLVTEDRVYTGPGSRAEVQFDYANFLRMASDSEVRFAQLESGHYVLQLARGTTEFTVLRDSGQRSDVEIDTPSVSFRPVVPGTYRITVLEDGTTQVTVRSGQAEIFSPRGTQRLDPGRTMLVRGNQSDPEFQLITELRPDEFDQWSQSRDRELEAKAAEAYRYVPRDVPGAEDLAGNGEWVYEQPYGYVWAPTVAETWAPYRYGRWSWLDWYGWSWVSSDPWGWAPYHYGRWFHGGHGWCWYPGPAGPRHYWSPALVSFVGFGGGGGWGFGFGVGGGWGNIGWIPLAPYEVYHPWWGYGHGGHNFNQVNVVNNINIVNNYRNARVANGITGVSAANFGRGGSANYVRVSGEQIRGASVVRGALPVAPGRESLRMVDRDPSRTVRTNDSVRSFYSPRPATNTVSRVPFEQQRQNMQEISRQAFGNGAAQSGSSAGRVLPNGGLQTAPRSTDNGAGWRRFGDPAGSVGRSADRPAASQPNAGSGSGRFGDPSAFRSSSVETPRNQTATEPRSQSPGGWTTPQATSGSGWRSESSRGWGNSESIRVNPPIVRDRPSETPRYAAPQSSAPRSEAPRYETPRYQAPQSSAPQRYEAPRYQAPQYSAPQRSEAPRYQAPQMSAPRSEAPRSSGRSEAPRSSYSGGGGRPSGGGGGHSSGGGGSRGGGGSHR